MTTSNRLTKLEAQRKKLDAQIKAAKHDETKKAAAVHNERCRILGYALIEEMKNNAALAAQIEPLLHARITTPKDRKMLGLD